MSETKAERSARYKLRYREDPEYRANQIRASFISHLRRNYGLTLEAYEALIEDSEGVCAACGKEMLLEGKINSSRAVVDHCHKTGIVRGIICNGCNRGIGYFGDNPEALCLAADYLRRHQPTQ